MSREADQKKIKEIIGLGQLRIPPSQRLFQWKASEVDPFLSDIIKEAKAEKKTSGGIYFGTVIAFKDQRGAYDTVYDIYDGQQRLTSVFITYLAIRMAASEKGMDKLKNACQSIIDFVDGNGENQGWSFIPSPSIKTPLEIAFHEGWTGEKPKSPGKGAHHRDKRFFTFYKRIFDEIAELDEDTLKALKRVVDELEVTFLSITETSEAYDLFERTNARGKALEVSDLLKNELFRRQRDIENIENRWAEVSRKCGGNAVSDGKITQMLRYFYMSTAGHVSQKEVYPKLKGLIGTGPKANEVLEEIEAFASFYEFMIDTTDDDFEGWAIQNGIPEVLLKQERFSVISKAIEALKFFRITQSFPLIYAAIKQLRDADDNSKKSRAKHLEGLLSLLETFHASYTLICGQPANKVEHLYADMAKQLASGVVTNNIRNKLASHMSRELMPSLEVFISYFVDISYKDPNSYNKLMFIFDRYFYWDKVQFDYHPIFKPASNAHNKVFQREHIYPLKPKDGEDYLEFIGSDEEDDIFHTVHNIGNLTVLNYANNSGKKEKKGGDGIEGVSNRSPRDKFAMLENTRDKNRDYVNWFLDDIKANPSEKWDADAISKRAHRIGESLFNNAFRLVTDSN